MNKYQYKVQGIDYDVEIIEVEGNTAKVNVNGISFDVEMKRPIKAPTTPNIPKATASAATVMQHTVTQSAEKTKSAAQATSSGTKVKAPLPGTITDIKVKVGDAVKDGDTIIVLEAMKMQNNIEAECNGTVTSVLVNKDDTVMEGDILITIG